MKALAIPRISRPSTSIVGAIVCAASALFLPITTHTLLAALTPSSAMEFCPAGTLSGTVRVLFDDPTPQTHTFAPNCVVAAESNIIFDATMAVSSSSTPAASQELTTLTFGPNVVVGRRSYLAIYAPEDNIDDRPPYKISIIGNEFQNDACMILSGSFPAGASIVISGNRFNASTPLGDRMPDPFGATSTWAACIAIYQMMLYDNTHIIVEENQIYGSNVIDPISVLGVYVTTSVYLMGAGASFLVRRNKITTVCNPFLSEGNVCGNGFGMGSAVYSYANGTISVDENTFYTAGAYVASMSGVTNPIGSGTYTFDSNTGVVNTQYLPYYIAEEVQPFITYGSVGLAEASKLSISNNSFKVVGTSAMITFDADFSFNEYAVCNIVGNQIVSQQCDPGLYMFDVSLNGNAVVNINYNGFYRNEEDAVYQDEATAAALAMARPFMYVGDSFDLKSQSKMIVAYNVFGESATSTAPSAKSTSILMDLSSLASSTDGFVFDTTASLSMCGNTVHQSTLSTVAQVKSSVNSALQSRVAASGCGVLAPATTKATTTIAHTTVEGATSTNVSSEESSATNNGSSDANSTIETAFTILTSFELTKSVNDTFSNDAVSRRHTGRLTWLAAALLAAFVALTYGCS